jgi:glycine/D-amino acid oxidase-like deaminating enzyme
LTSPSFSQGGTALEVDVVVVGGGVQGLWLLADLTDKGYSAVLLERARPGFGQTGHSHVFIHEGHIYAYGNKEPEQVVVQRIQSVQKAHGLWKDALQPGGRLASLAPIKSDFYIGLRDKNKATDFEKACRLTSMTCDPVKASPGFGVMDGLERLYRSEGFCLDSKALLAGLMGHGGLGQRAGRCTEIRVDSYDAGRFGLSVKCDSGIPLDVRARSLVLSAGAGNEKLLAQLYDSVGAPPDANAAKQQTVKTFMLVLRHKDDSMRPTHGMFPDSGGIFLVSRKDPSGRTVWLIGDRQRERVSHPGEITAFDAATWLQKFRMELDKLFPYLPSNRDEYEWGIYEATKAEPHTVGGRFKDGGAFPGQYHVHKHPAAPLWLTWPSLLTFAPSAAERIAADVGSYLSTPSPTDWKPWSNFCAGPLAPGECRWKTTDLLKWGDFIRCYS